MLVQVAVIFLCLAFGEALVELTGIKIPGSIIGMIMLTTLLQSGLIKPRQVSGACQALISNMGFFFIPAGVGLMLYLDLIAAEWIPILVASALSTVIVMLVTSFVHQRLRRHAPHSR
jgi:holin-like protein